MAFVDLRDPALLRELGARVAQIRVQSRLTQADLAERAGISLPTLTRFENGASIQLINFLRILRVLNLLTGLDQALPSPQRSPMQLLEQKKEGKPRRVRKANGQKNRGWTWDDPS